MNRSKILISISLIIAAILFTSCNNPADPDTLIPFYMEAKINGVTWESSVADSRYYFEDFTISGLKINDPITNIIFTLRPFEGTGEYNLTGIHRASISKKTDDDFVHYEFYTTDSLYTEKLIVSAFDSLSKFV